MTFALMHRCAIDGNRTASGNKLKCQPRQRWAPLRRVPIAGRRAISRTIPDKTLTRHSHTATHQQGQRWQEQLHIQSGEWINAGRQWIPGAPIHYYKFRAPSDLSRTGSVRHDAHWFHAVCLEEWEEMKMEWWRTGALGILSTFKYHRACASAPTHLPTHTCDTQSMKRSSFARS